MDKINYLTELKQDLEKAKITKSKLEGNLEVLMKELKEKFDCNSIEEAVEKMEQMEKTINTRSIRLERSIDNLQAKIEKNIDK